jgi:Zn-dependent M28 family amino/carboxypeptidase
MARRGWAGEMSGLFEHPACRILIALGAGAIDYQACHNSFFTACKPAFFLTTSTATADVARKASQSVRRET